MIALAIALTLVTSAHAGTITIVTDEPGAKHANRVKDLLATTPPFNRVVPLDVEVVSVGSDQLRCQLGRYGIERLIQCDEENLRKIVGERGANRLIVVKQEAKLAGSGGEFAIITTGTPPLSAIHELLHSFGFRDEYPFLPGDADVYCYSRRFGLVRPPSGPNLAFFEDTPPYASDAVARTKHAADIPWFGSIRASTRITTGTALGTPKPGLTGLYPGSTCVNAKVKLKTWKPGSEPTIMEIPDSTLIPEVTWDAIANNLDGTILRGSAVQEASAIPKDDDGEASR